MGRPPLPQGKAKANQMGVRFTPEVTETLEFTAPVLGKTPVEIVREATQRYIDQFWVFSKWNPDELHNKKVMASINGALLECELFARGPHRGKIAITVAYEENTGAGSFTQHRFNLTQQQADQLVLSPKGSGVPYLLTAALSTRPKA